MNKIHCIYLNRWSRGLTSKQKKVATGVLTNEMDITNDKRAETAGMNIEQVYNFA
jgi:hypothetical protein